MTDDTPLLVLNDITKRYAPPGDANATDVLRGVNLSVDAGESVAVTGPSGSGKSTLLNVIGALDRPTSGHVRFAGADLADMNDARLASLRNRQIGFVFQVHHLLPQCSAIENVLVPTLVQPDGPARNDAESRAAQLLQRVGLGERMHHRPGELSGGEQQRVAVVRALINRPRLLLADEPTGSLDRDAALSLGELLVELNREEGVTLIVVTHTLDLAALMHRQCEMRHGVLIGAGT